MHATRRRFCCSLFGASLAAVAMAAVPADDAREIAGLIAEVERADGVVFLRNGRGHSAREAAAHLRRKWKASRGRIRTTDEFIRHLGTRSSTTGRAYRVRLRDGREIDSTAWLRGLLRGMRARR